MAISETTFTAVNEIQHLFQCKGSYGPAFLWGGRYDSVMVCQHVPMPKPSTSEPSIRGQWSQVMMKWRLHECLQRPTRTSQYYHHNHQQWLRYSTFSNLSWFLLLCASAILLVDHMQKQHASDCLCISWGVFRFNFVCLCATETLGPTWPTVCN